MKPPRIISIIRDGRGTYTRHRVTITTYMFHKLPEWVRAVMRYHYAHDNIKHTVIDIGAVDELQAMSRFLQLWNCLPKEEV
jgi:hypothetical protein